MPSRKTGSAAKILRSEIIYKGPVFGVRRDEVLEPNGVRALWWCFRFCPTVGFC